MKTVLVAAAGRVGTALNTAFTAGGHTVLTTGRSTGDFSVELAGVEAVYSWSGKIDGAASAVGVTPVQPVQEMTADYRRRWPCAGGVMVPTGSGDVGARHHSPLGQPFRSTSTRRGGGVGITSACIPPIVARAPPDHRDNVVEAVWFRKHTRRKGWEFSLADSMTYSWSPLATVLKPQNRFGRRHVTCFRYGPTSHAAEPLPDHYAVDGFSMR
jgi:hypothetical protein